MDYFEIMEKVRSLKLRTHTGKYTFSFKEGDLEFILHLHSTGREFYVEREYGVLAKRVCEFQNWYSKRYYHNGFGKGFSEGPWCDDIKRIMKECEDEIKLKSAKEMLESEGNK